MRTRISVSKASLFLTLALAFLAASNASAAASKPWYAARLESFGFYVFNPPFASQDFQVTSLSGGQKARSSLKGKVVLLNFWATWCPPCKEEIPSIESLSKTMKGQAFEVFAVNLGDDAATVKSFVTERKLSFPIYLDTKNKLASSFASQGIPTTYLLGKDGTFIAGVVGSYDYSKPEFVAFLKELAQR
ncbi:TlpA family protein disulfide reductase [bacterium]|nr:TlpA family protein disulfide reductase [bacterium]